MKDLPRVYPGKVRDDINNTQEFYYGNERSSIKKDSMNVIKKINNIFSSSSHVYKSKVRITKEDGDIIKVIVGKTNTDLITIEGELIRIVDIIDINKI